MEITSAPNQRPCVTTSEANEFLALNMSEEEPLLSGECCIYRVPSPIRGVNPEAYTPQMVLIGPLQHSRKRRTRRLMEMDQLLSPDIEMIESRYKTYMDMEKRKKFYYHAFCQRHKTEGTKLRRMIEENEERIRSCYAESTTSIKSAEFVNMILLDAVFIMELMYRSLDRDKELHKDDIVVSRRCIRDKVWLDLKMLENQLPYFILEDLYNSVFPAQTRRRSFHSITTEYFHLEHVKENEGFKHFTDLMRYSRIRNIVFNSEPKEAVRKLCNAEKLREAGVQFKVMKNEKGKEKEDSINMTFKGNCLEMAPIFLENGAESEIRNIMALEQCHYQDKNYVCSYMMFLDFLINTEKDVELLVDKGIIKSSIGDPKLVADMINKLITNIYAGPSCYFEIADELNIYSNRFWNRNVAYLKHNYFNNVWKGTATIAAGSLLLLTLGQMITSVIQVMPG